jgi:hypothetical protein
VAMKKLGEFKVNLRLTDEAKRYLADLMRMSELENPILEISWGKWNHETEYRWLIGFHDRENCGGWLCTAPEFEFLIIHPSLAERLNDRVLDIRDTKASIH